MMSTVASNSPLIRARFRISGFGSAYPSGTLTNRELADQFGVFPFWIESRCGIQYRGVVAPGETTHSLGVAAARQALATQSAPATGLSDLRYFYTGISVVSDSPRHRAKRWAWDRSLPST